MMNARKYILVLCTLYSVLCTPVLIPAYAVDTLRLDLPACRQMALDDGLSSQSMQESRLAAEYNRKAALAAMFPRISANGSYMWNSRQAHLIPVETPYTFGAISIDPSSAAGQLIADAYQVLYEKMTVDLTHVVVAQVGITQPIYVGGRLAHLYKIAKASENIAAIESKAKQENIIYAVDEAYWRVVSVAKKKELAQKYLELLCQLESDVKEAAASGLATQSDLLMVATKRGDAEVKKLQAENGLTLSNMALAQLCGQPLSTAFVLDERELNETSLPFDSIDTQASVANRSEMQILQETEKIARSNAMLMAAGLQPSIVASAGYIYTNPNVENGVSNDWNGKGFFSAGVVVHVPIVHADDILRYKAAKHTANALSLKTEETRELLTLQTTQANQKLTEAQQKIVLARLTESNAAEVLRMAQESYAAGLITVSELMQAQTAWLAASSDLVDAQIEAKTTEAQLRKFSGK